MDFEYSAKTKTLQARVSAFMDEHVYPNEAACTAELAKVQSEGAKHSDKWHQFKRAQTWLHRDQERIPSAFHAEIASARAASPALDKLVLMREELRLLWTRTNVSVEQLVHDLQLWCRKAEESGISELRAFSQALRAAHA